MSSELNPLILITGACGGMGNAAVDLFLSRGWRVLAVDCDDTAKNTDTDFFFLKKDLSQKASAGDVADQAILLGGLQAVIHLAGISEGTRPLDGVTDSGWEKSLQVNATTPMSINRRLGKELCHAGYGSIVHVGSPVGIVGASKPAYAASKAALHGLTMSLARAYGPSGVRVNTLLPGTCITRMTQDWNEEKRQRVAEESFLKRLCTPQEVAEVLYFLCGPKSQYLTGSIVDMTAGGLWGH